MTLHLYDTYARARRVFEPVQPGMVTMYVCGVTVQGPPHVGHIRFAVSFDVLRRWLEHLGHQVIMVRNVTDVDDKVIAKAAERGTSWWELAYRNERECSHAYDLVGCRPATYEPRATGHIPEMVALIERIIAAGHAYPSGGDVLFDASSFAEYGALSRQRLEDLQPAGDTENAGAKDDPRDFALWKAAKPGEPAWAAPWGQGRPGWHLECSAMATKYLGAEFDIHGGGVDLVFPHHENELAQSRAAGDPFARYWLHNAWVTMASEKMGKSLGNELRVNNVAQRVRPVELRYFLAAPHYRSPIAYSEDSLAEAGAAYRRLENFVTRAVELVGERASTGGVVPQAFADAMNDDVGVPQALAVVHDAVRAGNAAISAGDKEAVAARVAEVRAMLGVLGLDPLDAMWTSRAAGEDSLRGVLDALVGRLLEQRAQARARKDWTAADAIRDQLQEVGIEVTDTAEGARWSVSPQAPR